MSTPGEAVVIWGEVLWDRFAGAATLGGAPANVAWHLGLAGGWAQLVSRVGDDADGYAAIDRLSAVVDVSLIQLDRERATGEVTIALDGGEPRYTLHPGRAWERIAATPDATLAISEAGVFAYGTLAQRTPEGFAAWRAAIAAAGERCTKVCDPNLRPADVSTDAGAEVLRAALEAADVIKLNDREVGLVGARLGWRDPVAHLAPDRIVAVTHGARGSTIHHGGTAIEVAGIAAAGGGDHVGCGDAFVAILVHGMTCGWDLAMSARAASRWAAAVAEVRGATPLFDDDRVAELLEAA
ncbi:MAG TPA: PfkB family carbohydrate kinase [Kofleriaceae bacterium]|jgi:fructokinase